ncbi:MAG: DUF2508 family protein [Oscillospiraceae bacterium]
MKHIFSELFFRKKQEHNSSAAELSQSLTELTERLYDIRSAFDLSTDEAVIQALIFEENAVQCRLSALYKKARAEGIKLEFYERKQPWQI